MRTIYEVIGELNPNHENIMMTIIEGPDFGEKIIFSNGEVVFETKEGAFHEIGKTILNFKKIEGVQKLRDQRIFCEILGMEKKMVICGGGHVSIPVISMGKNLGFHVTVIEDRVMYANNARKAGADTVICDDFSKALETIEGDLDTYFIIVTRGHRYDQTCLKSILTKNHGYIGMIGSRIRIKMIKENLIQDGFSEEILNTIYAPIGLNIGAETPEEIAVSILGEIIEIKNGKNKSQGFQKEILKEILDENKKSVSKILATIVSRKGSAPRNIGTKMLIFPDGSAIGTIGGGCVESEIMIKARHQLMEEDREPKIHTEDMTNSDAEEEGMVCGGVVEIMLEVV